MAKQVITANIAPKMKRAFTAAEMVRYRELITEHGGDTNAALLALESEVGYNRA